MAEDNHYLSGIDLRIAKDMRRKKAGYDRRSIWSKKSIPSARIQEHTIYRLEGHDECSRRDLPDVFPEASTIRLIDVDQMCLKELTTAEDYVALSYVWGQGTIQKQTLRKDVNFHSQPGSLRSVWKDMSKVIQDAINLTRDIGATYFWCDTLCIIQDDPVSKPQQLALMGEIYNRSMVTFISVHGENANTELMPQPIEHQRDIRTPIETESVMEEIQNAKYSTRGWCYQEQMLAKRRIYFLKDYVIFHCRQDMFTSSSRTRGIGAEHHNHSDFMAYHPKILAKVVGIQESGHGSEWPIKAKSDESAYEQFFTRIIENFSARQLTNENDILDACDGILTAFQGQAGWPILAGLPLSRLPQALLWAPKIEQDSGKIFKRRHNSAGTDKLITIFPSWSWTGWCGGVAFNSGLHMFDDHQSLLKEIQVYSNHDWEQSSGHFQTPLRKRNLAALSASGNPSPGLDRCVAVLGFETDVVPMSRLLSTLLAPGLYHLATLAQKSAGILYMNIPNPPSQPSRIERCELVLLARATRPIYRAAFRIMARIKKFFPLLSATDTSVDIKYTSIYSEIQYLNRREEGFVRYMPRVIRAADYQSMIQNDDPKDAYDFLLVKWLDGCAERIGEGQIQVGVWRALAPVRKEILLR